MKEKQKTLKSNNKGNKSQDKVYNAENTVVKQDDRKGLIGLAIFATIAISLIAIGALLTFITNRIDGPDGGKGGDEKGAKATIHENGPNSGTRTELENEVAIHYTYGNELIGADQESIYLKVDIEGILLEKDQKVKQPMKVAIVVDNSGSMVGTKIEDVKFALKELWPQFSANDEITLIVFNSDATEIYNSNEHFDDEREEAYYEAIDKIVATGGTNLQSGFDMGIDYVEDGILDRIQSEFYENSDYRYMLIFSDGQANEGSTDAGYYETSFINNLGLNENLLPNRISTIGVGADYDDRLMSAIPLAWNGSYYFMESTEQASDLLSTEFKKINDLVAKDIQLEFQLSEGASVENDFNYRFEDDVLSINDIAAGDKSTFVLKIDLPRDEAERAAFLENPGNLILTYKDTDNTRQEISPKLMKLEGAAENEGTPLLSDDTVYKAFATEYIANMKWLAYENLDNTSNSSAKKNIEDAIEFIKAANKRTDNQFTEELETLEELLTHVDALDEYESINDSYDGRLLQKSNQSESYDKLYDK